MNTVQLPGRSAIRLRSRQSGAALVVGLILLMVITLLAISSMNTSTLDLQMAGNMQYARKALQASDYAIEDALAKANYDTSTTLTVAKTSMSTVTGDANDPDNYQSTTQFDSSVMGVTNVPGGGMSMGVGAGMKAYHFDVTAIGTSARNATMTSVQSFYIVGPGG